MMNINFYFGICVINFLFLLVEMLDYLISDNNLKDVLLREGINDQDILFIKELIAGYINPLTGIIIIRR